MRFKNRASVFDGTQIPEKTTCGMQFRDTTLFEHYEDSFKENASSADPQNVFVGVAVFAPDLRRARLFDIHETLRVGWSRRDLPHCVDSNAFGKKTKAALGQLALWRKHLWVRTFFHPWHRYLDFAGGI